MIDPTRVAAALESRTPSMLQDLKTLVEAESPSSQPEALSACAHAIAEIGRDLLGASPEMLTAGGIPHLMWRATGRSRVLILCHFDTVWPVGTLEERPFVIDEGRARGPGVFDMKGGLVQSLHALAVVGAEDVTILVTGDEETGSATSRDLIVDLASEVDAVLVPEPSERGALKIARKGILRQEIVLLGHAAHAGLEPHAGISTTAALVPVLSRLYGLGDSDQGTTVTPTTVVSGHAVNVVPDRAVVAVDSRAWSSEELDRVDTAVRSAAESAPVVGHEVVEVVRREPLPVHASAEIFQLAKAAASELGFDLEGIRSGGCSDGNLTAGIGIATLDGLGAVGAGAHAVTEYLEVNEMSRRAALLAVLVDRLGAGQLGGERE